MQPKKSLGQNFLTNIGIVASIAEAGFVIPDDIVLEIGPGKGVLTKELLDRGATVIAVEKDEELIPILTETFKKEIADKKLILVHDDVLKFDPASQKLKASDYKLIANIPYYITGAIIRKFLEEPIKPSKMVLLVQKEVAERIIARDKKESLLSISVKAFGAPYFVKVIKAGSFTPAPKVDSAILLIDNISDTFFEATSKIRFFEILHAGFAHKRKHLAGNLKSVFSSKEALGEKLNDCHILPNSRAEDLALEQWKSLSK